MYDTAPLVKLLDEAVPNPVIELKYDTGMQLLAAVILSAQCTDRRVNQVTGTLFKKYITVDDFADASLEDFASEIKSCGFYMAKAKSIIGASKMLREKFNSKIPETIEELTELPGVGRKTANLMLGAVYNKQTIVVDTHVTRVSQRLGLAKSSNPDKIELELQKILPQERWSRMAHQLLLHGRYTCTAKTPKCPQCKLNPICPWEFKIR